MPSNLPLTILIPVYNEGANFKALWSKIASSIRAPFSVMVVYDFDQDDTLPVISEIVASGESRLALRKNAYGRGVTGAIKSGMEAVEAGPVLVTMADLSDDLSQVDEMYGLYLQGFDLVCASRYMKGGRLVGGALFKQALSRMSGLTLHYLRGIPTHDATNSFKLYDAAMVRELSIESVAGFELGLELTVKAFLNNYRIAEIPSTWKDRSAGTSKFRLLKWLPHYLRWYCYAFQRVRRQDRAVRDGSSSQPADPIGHSVPSSRQRLDP